MLEAHDDPVRDPDLLPTMRRLIELEQRDSVDRQQR